MTIVIVASWDEIRSKIKHAYNEIESAYQEYVEPSVGKVKERPVLNTAVKLSLSLIPIIGPNLRDLYDNIGDGTKSEEDKAKEVLEFLKKLEQQNKEQFDRIAEDLKTNIRAINDAINQNKIVITDLISRSSAELLEAVAEVKDDTREIRAKVGKIEEILEQHYIPNQPKLPPKPSIYRGESTKILVGRKQDIDTIRNYFVESNLPVSITGEGGIGKSELAYKAMHKCEDMFDLITPVYFGSHLTFSSFLLEIAKGLNLPIGEFEKKDLGDRRGVVMNNLEQQVKRPLVYADNYETISRVLRMHDVSESPSTKIDEEKDNARKINTFLESVPANTAILLTSRERYNLDGERPLRLDGLGEPEGRDLFIELAKNHFLRKGEPSEEIKRALKELSRKVGGHPLSIELLARSYRGQGISKIREMLQSMGLGVVNPEEESERLQSLQCCFEYSFSGLPDRQKDLLSKLTLFNSPFPPEVVEEIFGFQGGFEILLDLYDHSLLRRIEFDEYANDDSDDEMDKSYHMYYFHPAVRNYLEMKVRRDANKGILEQRYGERFSLYYYKLVEETYNATGTRDPVLSLERFNVIISQGEDNDFERAIILAKDRRVASEISTGLGLILELLGVYGKALEYHIKALAIHEEVKDRVRMAGDYNNIGAVLQGRANFNEALSYHDKSLAIVEELNDRVEMAKVYRNIGNVLNNQGNYDQALSYHNKSLAILEELNDRVRMAKVHRDIGNVLGSIGDRERAIESFSKGLEVLEELQEKTGYHHALIDSIQQRISQIRREKSKGKLR